MLVGGVCCYWGTVSMQSGLKDTGSAESITGEVALMLFGLTLLVGGGALFARSYLDN